MFDKVCLIGVGLIGGSIAKAVRAQGLARSIVAYGKEDALDNLKTALDAGVIDAFYLDIASALQQADCVIIATPVGAFRSVFQELKPFWNTDTVYTDTGSTKASIVEAARGVLGYVPENFIPAHPIAGAEKSGVSAARDDLFENKRLIITPLDETCPLSIAKVENLWQKMGSVVSMMDVEHHDTVLAATSHLPHILAFSLVNLLGKKDEKVDIFNYAAGGFKDFSRIASSDPVMWQDICLANREPIIQLIQQLQTELKAVENDLVQNNSQALFEKFTYANIARQRFLNQFDSDMSEKITFKAQPGGCMQGEIRVPGDKSMSHRSIMLGSLAEGVTQVTGFLNAEDALATLNAFRAMGVEIEGPEKGNVTIHGVGKHGLKQPEKALYLGNSGTSMRLLAGLLAGQSFDTELTGDKSLSGRPMKRVTEPLATMGAKIETQDGGTAPLKITGTGELKAIEYDMPIASAQVKSCLLLAGMYAKGETRIKEPAPTRDHTERMLNGFSYPVTRDKDCASINSAGSLSACNIDVPSDISSAAFFLVGASIAANSDLTLKHVGINPTRTGVIDILRLMGANIEVSNEKSVGGEPVADIRVCSSQLKGIDIPEELVPLAIDEFPVLFVAAACAEGQTRLTGAKELRVKESDRIQVMADGLVALGVDAEATEDGMIIQGRIENSIQGGKVNSHGDHRIAMSFSIAALRATSEIVIDDCENVNTSFPEFFELANSVGLKLL